MAPFDKIRRSVGGGKKARIAALLALIPGLLGLTLLYWPVTAGLENFGLDLLFKLRGRHTPPSDVCVVAVDTTSYLEMGLDPLTAWPRGSYGELVRLLKVEGARSVAFDILFEAPRDREQDVQFELGLFDAGNVVLGSTVERTTDPRFRESRVIDPLRAFAESAAAVAEVLLPPDNDGAIRRTWLVPQDRPSLALAAYEVATGDTSYRVERGTRLIGYYGPPRTIPTVSLYQALDPRHSLAPGFFRDKIVFVGASQVAAAHVAEVKDSFPTPFSGGEVGFTYGVEIHATIAANLLEGRQVHSLPDGLQTALLLALALIASLLFIYVRPVIGIAVFLMLQLGAWIAGYVAFTQADLWIPVIVPSLVQLPAAYVVSLVWYYLTTVREREKIRRAFSLYLSPEMARQIAEDPDALTVGGKEIIGTAVFTDIKGFTAIAEKMTAEETASMLNEYFSELTKKIFDTDGTLVKYIGDAVFAIWGAPVWVDDHAMRACRTVVAMARVHEILGDRAAGQLVTRIGVHTGSMLVGNLGSAQRFDYTAIGDTVNLASRLESLNKAIGTRALVSGETLAATDGGLIVRALGRARVVGRAEPVALYELLGQSGEETRPDAGAIQRFERALADFTAGRFAEAADGFREVQDRCGGEDGPSRLYLQTIAELGAKPAPPDWDGVIHFVKK